MYVYIYIYIYIYIYFICSNRISTIGSGTMGWGIYTTIVFSSGIMCVRFKGYGDQSQRIFGKDM